MKVAEHTSERYETDLVEGVRSGERAAMEEFYDLYRNRLYFLVLEQVGQNHAVAEDLVQETFLAALSSLDKFRGDSQLYTWLRSIALHKINDFHRRQAREPQPMKWSSDFNALKLAQAQDDKPAVLNEIESDELDQLVHHALLGLPQDYQDVLVLKYLKDMPVLAISQILGRSPKSVEGLLSRARKAMRATLEENDYEK
jgi:RNA polymerase sigma-70 factor (ECF subfamily)